MSSFSDIVGQRCKSQDSRLDRTDFDIQKGKPKGSLTAALRTHESQSEGSRGAACDPLIQGLIDRLPHPDSVWLPSERAKWLRTAESIFDLVYKLGDADREVSHLSSTNSRPTEPISGNERKKVQALALQGEDA